jgi:hypothetical protein
VKVALLSDNRFPSRRWYPGYGLGRSLARLGTALAKRGHDVTIFCKSGSFVEDCTVVFDKGEGDDLATYVRDHWPVGCPIVDSTHQFRLMYQRPDWPIVAKICDLEGRAPRNRVYGCQTHKRWHQDEPGLIIPEGIDVNEYPFYPGPRQPHLLFVGRGMMAWKRPDIAKEVADRLSWPIHFHGEGQLPFEGAIQEEPLDYPAFFDVLGRARAVIGPTPTTSVLEGAVLGTPGLSLSPDDNLFEEGVTGFSGWTVDELVEKAQALDTLDPQRMRDWVASERSIDQTALLWEQALERVAEGERW